MISGTSQQNHPAILAILIGPFFWNKHLNPFPVPPQNLKEKPWAFVVNKPCLLASTTLYLQPMAAAAVDPIFGSSNQCPSRE